MLVKEIPKVQFPNIGEYVINKMEEEIVSITEAGILCDSQYYKQGIPGAYKDCYARVSVVERLLKAENLLPNGLHLKVYDAYRPICIQQRLWNYYRQYLKNEYPELNDKELDYKTSFFISRPSYNTEQPSLHNTGGAVDLTLVDNNGKELKMGTKFDEFSDKAWTNHFEQYSEDIEVRDNRRILYWTMLEAGFTNLPSEWWHYDYGTKFWAYFNNETAKYEGVLDLELPNRFPIM